MVNTVDRIQRRQPSLQLFLLSVATLVLTIHPQRVSSIGLLRALFQRHPPKPPPKWHEFWEFDEENEAVQSNPSYVEPPSPVVIPSTATNVKGKAHGGNAKPTKANVMKKLSQQLTSTENRKRKRKFSVIAAALVASGVKVFLLSTAGSNNNNNDPQDMPLNSLGSTDGYDDDFTVPPDPWGWAKISF